MDVRRLLRERGIRPNKGLGQNFLVDQTILAKIAAAADLTSDDVVLEIGAGTGALTRLLAQEAGHVIAVELDQHLMSVLRSELSDASNVTLIQGDILSFDISDLISRAGLQHPTPAQYKVVANLPYYITSAILRQLLETDLKPRRIVVTLQREVAKRIVAKPGQMSLLAVSVQFYGTPKLLFPIKSGSFYPSPDVASAVVRIDPYPQPPLSEEKRRDFFRIVRAGFSQRRKQLHNALSSGLKQVSKQEAASLLKQVGIAPRRRAQTLSIEEWVKITQVMSALISE